MNLKSLIFSFLLVMLCGLASFRGMAAESRNFDPAAALVVVVNQEPANPAGGEIWLMDLTGRLVRRLTKNNFHEERPKFSPDGRRIVFVRNLGGVAPGIGIDPRHNEIFVYDPSTGEEMRLTRNDVEDGHPDWSYDGKLIAFHSRRGHPEGRATVWVMEANGSQPRQLTSIMAGDLSHTDPVWSPDGQWLVFVSQREEGAVRYSRIEKIRRDGTRRTVVSSGGRPSAPAVAGQGEPLGDLDPAHSPDGAMIWSARRLEGGKVRLFAFGAGVYYGGKAERDMNGSNPPGMVERSPRFSPDGMRVVFTRSAPRSGLRTRQVVITDIRSSFRRFVTSREDWDAWHPSWHPFARSGTERDFASRVVTYTAKGIESGKPSTNHRFEISENVQFASSPAELAAKTAAATIGSVIGWWLDVPSEKVISLALRFEGKLNSEAERDGAVALELMDWVENRWVSVFSRPEGSGGGIKIYHEISPANFIDPQTRQVRLRVVVTRLLAGPAPGLLTELVSLGVRRD